MHAEATYGDTGSKFGKIAIVAALHVGAALALFNMKTIITVAPTMITDLAPLPTPADPPTPPEPEPLPVDKLPDLPPPPFRAEQVTIDDPIPTPPLPKAGPVDIGPPVPGDEGRVTAGGGGGGGGNTVIAPKQQQVFTAALANAKDCVLPDYPKNALRNGDTGTVSLALLIGTNGQVTESKVQKSSGFRELDRAAIAALSMCKFKPATSNGVAQPAWGQMAYVWRLD